MLPRLALALACLLAVPSLPATEPAADFTLEVMVDFPDDATESGRPLTPADIDAMMVEFKRLGIRRVSWGYYADGHGGLLNPAGFDENGKQGWRNYEETVRRLGNPLAVAVAAGHRHGLEVYAYFKPYETGPGLAFPAGSPEAAAWGHLDLIGGRLGWLDPFVRDHPHLRIKRRTDDLRPDAERATIASLRLTKQDDAPTRITKERLQIWTSDRNYRYQRKQVPFTLTETVERAPDDVRNHQGHLLTRKGAPVRVLTLGGLALDDRFVLVTTDFADGPGDFTNSGLKLLTALDAAGAEIPGVVATAAAVWAANLADFRTGGLAFDYGWGGAAITLDAPNARPALGTLDAGATAGKPGLIAFSRGRNAYLPGALCETEPEVQRFWLQCLQEMIDAGVDGVDFREESHSTHTDHPEDYGFNEVVLQKARARAGDLLVNIAQVRGEAYRSFLAECHRRLAAAGRRMRYNLQADFLRADAPPGRRLAYPANLDFDWRAWIRDGSLDAAILRYFALPASTPFDDPVARDLVATCAAAGMPVTVNQYVDRVPDGLAAHVRRVRQDGRFAGYILYEACSFLRFGADSGSCRTESPAIVEAAAAARP